MKGLIWFLICISLPRPRSTMVGKLSSRSVCPVGAVSKTTTEKFIPFTNLVGPGVGGGEFSGATCGVLAPQLAPRSPHHLGVAHGLVDAGEGAHGFLHHLLAHAQHVVLLKELVGEFRHSQAGVDLLGGALWGSGGGSVERGSWGGGPMGLGSHRVGVLQGGGSTGRGMCRIGVP